MDSKLIGKIAVVTGGTSGIGRAAVDESAKHGATVVVIGRDSEKFTEAFGNVNDVHFVAADTARPIDIANAMKVIKRALRVSMCFSQMPACLIIRNSRIDVGPVPWSRFVLTLRRFVHPAFEVVG